MVEHAKLRAGFGGVKDSDCMLQNLGSRSGTYRLSCPLDSCRPSGERSGLQTHGSRSPVSRWQLCTQVTSEVKVAQSAEFSRWSSQRRNRTGSPALQADSLPAEPPRMTRGIALLSKEAWEAAVWEERPWLKDQQGIQESRQIWEAGGQKERSKDGGILQRREDNSAKFCMKLKASIWTVLVTLAVGGHWWHLSRRFQVNRGAGSRLSVKTGPSD